MVKVKKFIALLAVSITSNILSAQDCYESSILTPTPFMGNDGEIFKLDDGTLWEIKYEYEYLYEYYPDVIVCPSTGRLVVDGKTLNIEQVGGLRTNPNAQPLQTPRAEVIESRIDGEFEGWEGETIVKLINGQIWQQSEYYYHYHYSYSPKVLVYRSGSGYKMQVDGISKSIGVLPLN